MQTFWHDLRYGARTLAKNRGFAAIALLTLALGIGANTAIFSVVNAVLLRPLPYAEPARLVSVAGTDTGRPGARIAASYPDFFDWRERNRSFEGLAAYHSASLMWREERGGTEVSGQVVTADLFDLLGAKPHLGRGFARSDERPGGGDAAWPAILSHRFWQERFGGDPRIVGRTMTLDRRSFEIVGVMPPGFQFPIQADPVDLWVTPAIDFASVGESRRPVTERRGYRFLEVLGRLRPGVTLAQAQSEMDAIAANLTREYPDNNLNNGILLQAFDRNLTADYRQALLVVFAAVGCVLLIACANVANLLLGRAVARRKELAVRAALGAARGRLLRQMLTESLLLSLGGGALGLLPAWWGIEGLMRLLPADLPRGAEVALDPQVLGFAFASSLLTGLLFGLAPALQASRIDLAGAMKTGASPPPRARLRSLLVVGEVALAVVLLIAAGLLTRTFLKLQRVELGFDARNVLTAELTVSDSQYPGAEQKAQFFQRAVERVRALPGVASAGAILPLPLSGDDVSGSFQLVDRPAPPGQEAKTQIRFAGLDYFCAMKIPLLAGRDFTARDDLAAPAVAIVSRQFVNAYFPNESPLGKRLLLPMGVRADETTCEIVGVVNDVKHRSDLGREAEPELYLPYAQLPFVGQMSLVVRATVPAAALARDVQRELAALDREVSLRKVRTYEQHLGAAIAQPRLNALLFGLFALLAFALGVIGLYGVMAYAVTQRTREIGVRLALGARTPDILAMVLGQGMRLALLGVAIGIGAALALTRLLTGLLFGVAPADPLTFIAVPLALALVALLACWLPARRAMQVDPMTALREE